MATTAMMQALRGARPAARGLLMARNQAHSARLAASMGVRANHGAAEGQAKPAEAKEAPSAAPAGTVFTGLSIYKDKPDPVARPESEYPPWLFALLDDPAIKSSKTVGAGDVDTTGMSKGEARAALKRSAKAARQAAKKQAVAEAREAARRARRGEPLEEKREEVQEEKGPTTPAEAFEIELRQRRELRKKNRASIKAANFVKST